VKLVQDRCWVCGIDILPDDNFCRKCGAQLVRPETDQTAVRGFTYADRQVSIGIFLTIIGTIVGFLSYLMGIVPMLAFGLASLLVGILVLYLPERRGSIAARLATESSLPSLLNIENLLEDLDLDERGIYIPASGLGICPRVFIPLVGTEATRHPPVGLVSSRRIFVTVGKNPEDRGVLLDAPGGQILVALEQSLHTDLSKTRLDELGAAFNSGFRALGIAKSANFEADDSSVKIEIELATLIDLETKLRNIAPRLVAQVGTPVTSAVAAAVSKAAGRYVTFKSAILDLSSKKVSVNLRLSP
jgi:hypothetical protein